MGLQSRITIAGGYAWTSGSLTAAARFGAAGMPAGALVLADGTGAGQANFVYAAALSVPAATMQAIDLKGGGGELDVLNVALAATAVKVVVLQVTTPGASASLRFGPQGQTDAAQLWFPGVGATDYAVVKDKLYMDDARAGWAVGAATKKLCVYNPGGAAVAAKLLVMGTK